MMTEVQLKNDEDIETAVFIEAIKLKYGYNFSEYSRDHIKRRIQNRLVKSDCNNIMELAHRVIKDESLFEEILSDFSITVTEMFRDPAFFKYLRNEIVPVLESYPQIKIWHAGCSSGEEAYSMAIILKEAGLYDRCQIYATDFNRCVLSKAKAGIYDLESIKTYTHNYNLSGGIYSFSDYYIAKYKHAILDSDLKRHIVFAEHNLVTDGSFGEMNLIMCRNVLIYFEKSLQNKVNHLFVNSLLKGGYLFLGSKETLAHSAVENHFETVSEAFKVYRHHGQIIMGNGEKSC
ncbi:protein-glutamate O-methyltransferase CheR [Fusibacter sp. 3D3]|uniref:CheR family methyltransferase n=1 Tax=Fusibacter sp. 3D3 TaxID=1048380 RepID=UPI0008574C3D|nr:protein-glutamate O-methyltransferase CheR [Fusibacter sp. 3D3]GAU78937.1 chemotaxis protein methyltransferase CheR [Fusibacter sp. 3D3]